MIVMPQNRFRRDINDVKSIGKSKGTNIQMIRLVYRRSVSDSGDNSNEASLDAANDGKLPKEASSRKTPPIKAGLSAGTIVGIVLAVLFLVIALSRLYCISAENLREKLKDPRQM